MHCGADEIVATLKEAGVRIIFGIPSIHNISLYEALRKEPSIRHILCRQETTAAHMADGYARAGGRLGVVLSSTGPGSGYMVPALQEAWGSCSPVLMITTNIATSKIGRGLGVLHELEDQESLFRSITKATISIRSGDNIKALTRKAIEYALTGRPGPVYLEVPTDLLDKAPPETCGSVEQDGGKPEGLSGLDKALRLLQGAKRPLIIVGAEAARAGLAGDVITLAERLAAPVITTANGKGVIAEDHLLSFGNAARRGAVREVGKSCDVALAIGTRLRHVDAKRRGLLLPQLIHVDWDDKWINKNFPAEIALVGDIRNIVKALAGKVESGSARSGRLTWIQKMRERVDQELREIRERHVEIRYLEVIRKLLPRDSSLIVDNTQFGYWAEYFYPSYSPGGLIAAKGSSIIGFAFPAAIGGKIACPEKQILALIGDGGFLYCAHELATCIRHRIGFPIIVVNDNAYGVIAHLQRTTYKEEYESRLANPDFVALARAYGAKATKVDSPEGLEESLKVALASQDLWVIELVGPFPEPPFSKY
ncbi:MAG TPA: thiamine pyrophosphate-binding protein [Acidobacteriota bacterium]|nr:thiamine pyrophosphate-binding protein [Acidobacteriota bacterium]